MTDNKNRIVVGIDGSEGSATATRWAIAEARSRRLSVHLVLAFVPTIASEWYHGIRYDIPAAREGADNIVEKALEDAKPLAGDDVQVTAKVVEGQHTEVLEDQSAQAELLVLGSRHFGTGRSLLGSVSCAVAARSRCPVVVVRGPGGTADNVVPVVIGVDGTEHSEHVLAFGFEYANRQGLPVETVLCWNPHPLARVSRLGSPTTDELEKAVARLDELVRTWADKYPQVKVEKSVVDGHPIEVLVERSANCDLLVVGAKGRHAIAGTLLGSVSQGVLHHADCPVAVVHAERHES